MKKITSKTSFWNIIGWVEVLTTIIILGYYLMIMSWVTVYLKEYVTGEAFLYDSNTIQSHFNDLQRDPGTLVAYSALISGVMAFVAARGLQGGVELVSKIFYAGSINYVHNTSFWLKYIRRFLRRFMVVPYSQLLKITFKVILAALGQIFFSVGIALTAGFVFGSYLDKKNSDIPGSVGIVVFFDTAIAILAGFVIFPALFAFGIEPNAGPGLLFVTMASLFKEIPLGMFFGGLFFFLVFIAAFTSIIGLLEAVISTAMDSFKISRTKSVILCVLLTFSLCVPNILGFSIWSDIQIFELSIFGFFDYVSAIILLPLGGLLISVYVAYGWGFDKFMTETNEGSGKLKVTPLWGPVMKFIIPVIILVILIAGLLGDNLA